MIITRAASEYISKNYCDNPMNLFCKMLDCSVDNLSAKTGKQNFPARQNFQRLFPHVKIQEDIGNSSCWTRVDPFLRCALLDICFGILIVFFDDANFKCCTFFGTFLVILYDVTYFHFPVRCP